MPRSGIGLNELLGLSATIYLLFLALITNEAMDSLDARGALRKYSKFDLTTYPDLLIGWKRSVVALLLNNDINQEAWELNVVSWSDWHLGLEAKCVLKSLGLKV